MKNKITYFIVTIGLLMLLAGGLRYQQVSAQRISPSREIFKLEPISTADSIGVIQQETTEESEGSDSPPSEQFPNSVYVSSEQKTKNDEVIAALKEIKDKADQAQTHLSPGWLRITYPHRIFFFHYQPLCPMARPCRPNQSMIRGHCWMTRVMPSWL